MMRTSRGFTFVGVVVAIYIVAILIALLLPAAWESARRMQGPHNRRQEVSSLRLAAPT